PIAGEARVIVEIARNKTGHQHGGPVLPAEAQHLALSGRRRNLDLAEGGKLLRAAALLEHEAATVHLDPRRPRIGGAFLGLLSDHRVLAFDEAEQIGIIAHVLRGNRRRTRAKDEDRKPSSPSLGRHFARPACSAPSILSGDCNLPSPQIVPSGNGTPALVKASRWRPATAPRSEPAIVS